MKRLKIKRCLLAWALLAWTTACVAAAPTLQASPAASSAARASAPAKQQQQPSAKKKIPQSQLVDINGANKAALKKLPGIDDSLADKIIAGRPYGSKTWLVTQGVLPPAVFGGLRDRVIARQPFKTAAENLAYFEKLKKKQ